jgi:cytochrome P450
MMPVSNHEHLPYVDTDSAAYIDDPFAALTAAGATRGIARGPHGVEIFFYDQVKALLDHKQLRPTSADFFKGQGATLPILEFINDGLLLMMEPKRHLAVRKVLVKGFKPRTIEANRTMMAEFAHQLLDDIQGRNTMDFVGDFSHHYSIGVISRFIGVEPEDVPLFEHATVELRVLAENPMEPFVPRLEKALAELRAYAEKLVAARRKEKRSDLISDLIEAQ